MTKILYVLAGGCLCMVLLLSSCNSQQVTTEEKTTIETRDSVSRAAAEAREKLEAQTRAVEASIEEMDETFKKN